ncbi:MAG: DinB family protein [Candidatus Arcticimaribacter sp.]
MNLHLQLWQDFIDLCQSLTPEQYTLKCKMLNGVSIAEHLRHSYEFYHCLLLGLSAKEINYENRLRDRNIEGNLAYAITRMIELKAQLESPLEDVKMKLFSKEAQTNLVNTSFERELVYCLDHAVHHQALIKIGLKEQDLSHLVSQDFGVAYSTLRYRKQH